MPAIDIGEAREVADNQQRPRVAKEGRSSIASYGVGTKPEISEVRNGDPPEVDTVSGIVGDRCAVQKEVGALLQGDAGPLIAADGSALQAPASRFPCRRSLRREFEFEVGEPPPFP